jgi:hypothetical protein
MIIPVSVSMVLYCIRRLFSHDDEPIRWLFDTWLSGYGSASSNASCFRSSSALASLSAFALASGCWHARSVSISGLADGPG